MQPLVSVCIGCHNQGHLLEEAIQSVTKQDYPSIEIILVDDASTDNTRLYKDDPRVKYFRSEESSGTGGVFNKAIWQASGQFIVLLCSDDIFTDTHVLSDIVAIFKDNPKVGHVSRSYYQFIHGSTYPVRAWRGKDVYELANNPSGLAFRRETLFWPPVAQAKELRRRLSNRMFVEASTLVHEVMDDMQWDYHILPYDTIAVRIHASISRNKAYYKKRWTSSPVEEWVKVGGTSLLLDYTSLLQIKTHFVTSAVFKEIWNFIRLRPRNLLAPGFWFFSFVAVVTPRFILRHIPHLYRITIGRWTTRELKRS